VSGWYWSPALIGSRRFAVQTLRIHRSLEEGPGALKQSVVRSPAATTWCGSADEGHRRELAYIHSRRGSASPRCWAVMST